MEGKGTKRSAPTEEPEDAPRSKRMVPTSDKMRYALRLLVEEATDTDILDALKENGAFSTDDQWWVADPSGLFLVGLAQNTPVMEWIMQNTTGRWTHQQVRAAVMREATNFPVVRILVDAFPDQATGELLAVSVANVEVLTYVASLLRPTDDIAWNTVRCLHAYPWTAAACLKVLHPYVNWAAHRDKDLPYFVHDVIDRRMFDVLAFIMDNTGYELSRRDVESITAIASTIREAFPILFACGYTQRSPILQQSAATLLRKYLERDAMPKWYLPELQEMRRFGIRVFPVAPADGSKWKRGAANKFDEAMWEVEKPRRFLVAALSSKLPVELCETAGDFLVLRTL